MLSKADNDNDNSACTILLKYYKTGKVNGHVKHIYDSCHLYSSITANLCMSSSHSLG